MKTALTSEQRARLRYALIVQKPRSAATAPKRWLQSRVDVDRALRGRNLAAGLAGAVFIESCVAMDRIITRPPIANQARA